MFFRQKVAVDLLLDVRRIPQKFGCICLYRVQMHNEHTNILLYIYIDISSLLYPEIGINQRRLKLLASLKYIYLIING
jgi:hypothetical protein